MSRLTLRGFSVGLLLVTLAGGALRLAAMEGTRPVELQGDEIYYLQVADSIARRGIHAHRASRSLAWRPPAHPFVLSFVANTRIPPVPYRFEEYAHPLLRMQVLLGALLVAATGWLGLVLFDRRTGLVAAAGLALYPAWIAHSHTLWSEPLFALLVTAALALAVTARGRERPWLAIAAGAAFGAATLTRELALGVAGIAALWSVACAPSPERRRAALHAALLLASALAVVLPWTLRNAQLLEAFVPVSTIGWYAAAEGNHLDERWFAGIGPAGFAFRREYFRIPDEVARRDFARQRTLERIAAEQPSWLAKKLVRAVGGLASPESWLLYKIARGAYGDVPLATVRVLGVLAAASFVALAVLGTLGIAAAPRPQRWLAWGVLAGILAVHVFANATVRFRLPWIPLLAVYAGAVLADPSRLGALDRRRWIAVGVGLALVLGLGFAYYAGEAAVLWRAGSAARGR